MGAAALLLLAPIPMRVQRWAWAVLALAGIALGVTLNTRPAAPTNLNFVHYYLGAKYPIRYDDFYRMVQAGGGGAQVGIRDLEHPAERVRPATAERRAYYIDLLRGHQIAFDALAPLETLAEQARAAGLVSGEAGTILSDGLPASRVAAFVDDVHLALPPNRGRPLTDDYGYNGSPFYAMVRQLDPVLHLRYDSRFQMLGLLWQVLAALGFVWILGAAIGLDAGARVMSCALLFASWDFTGYSLPGLIFGEAWIAVAIAALALRRQRPELAGAAIAWAGLVKLFPFALLIPAALRGAHTLLRRPAGVTAASWAPRLLVSAVVTTLVLGFAAIFFGHGWLDFAHKIRAEFLGVRFLNNVSIGQGLMALGVRPRSWVLELLGLAALAGLAAMFWSDRESDRGVTLARRALVMVAAGGFVASSWLNYYAILPLVLLPWYARAHPRFATVVAGSFALSFLLPEFDAHVLRTYPPLLLLKLLPYWIAPVGMVALELRELPWSVRQQRFARSWATAMVVIAALECWRMAAARGYERSGDRSMAGQDAVAAASDYRQAARLSPGNAGLRMSEAVAWMAAGDPAQAREQFTHAVALDPRDAMIRDNFGRLLMMTQNWDEAGAQLEIARTLSPDDPEVLCSLGRTRWAQGRTGEARALLGRAHELDPADGTVSAVLLSYGGP